MTQNHDYHLAPFSDRFISLSMFLSSPHCRPLSKWLPTPFTKKRHRLKQQKTALQ